MKEERNSIYQKGQDDHLDVCKYDQLFFITKKESKSISIKGQVDHLYIDLINSYRKKKVKVFLKRAEMIIRIRIWSTLVPSSDLGRSRSKPGWTKRTHGNIHLFLYIRDLLFNAPSPFSEYASIVHISPNHTTGSGVLFSSRCTFSIEIAKFWPILTNICYFVVNLRTFRITFLDTF